MYGKNVMDVWIDIQMYRHTDGCMDVQTYQKMYGQTYKCTDSQTYQPSIFLPKKALYIHLTCQTFSLFKANFLHLKVLEILLESLQTTLRMNPHWVYIGGSGQNIKNKDDKGISFVMNMLTLYHVRHLHAEMEGGKPIRMPKFTHQASLII